MNDVCALNKVEIARLKLYEMMELGLDKNVLIQQSQLLDGLILEEMKKQVNKTRY